MKIVRFSGEQRLGQSKVRELRSIHWTKVQYTTSPRSTDDCPNNSFGKILHIEQMIQTVTTIGIAFRLKARSAPL